MNSNMMPTPSRYNWMDALKVFSTFLIFFNHGISHVWLSHPMNTFTWKFTHFIFLLSRIAVPLFFMCSGAGMLRKAHPTSQIFKKNIFQLLKIYICWMLVYGIVSCISLYQENLATLRTCVNAIIKSILFGQYHTWFILTLLSLYLITPFLFLITRTRENMQYFLILSLFFSVLLPYLGSFSFLDRLTNTMNNFNMHFVYGYILYYVAGYYISTVSWKKTYNYVAAVIFVLSFSFTYLYSLNISITTNTPYQEIFNELSPLLVLTVFSVFSIFKGLDKHLTFNLLKPLTGYGYALYLMHPLFLIYIQQLSGGFVFPGIIVLYLFCVLICYSISKSIILSKLFLK